MSSKINCAICNAEVHSIEMHLREAHPTVSVDDYKASYPGFPLLSKAAEDIIAKRAAAAAASSKVAQPAAATAASTSPVTSAARKPLHEVFGLPESQGKGASGKPIPVTMLKPTEPSLVPDIDDNYVFDSDNLKNALMALELEYPLYVWGHAGTGKTTLIEQICARTGRMLLRVQHTVNTEESHIVGQWTARGGETIFELGPLALAMKNGWVYLADEYDFALPSVLSVYQPVLEGKSLVIKEAAGDNRIIRPHPDFRFVATGNTNGSGDETGLYQGTSIQNAANYDRFHMVIEQKYMAPALEKQVLIKQAGLAEADAEKLVDFASKVRQNYDDRKISTPISPRTLIAVAGVGVRKSSFRAGVNLCFAGKLTRVDREVVDGLAQRIFG
ncbi:AAA family ATPase [Methyloversatilis sp.]|uniref:AAA family ATPase n=1 Tax=Methyloversatilis sp. TaxID=2569862 RepID=UPI0035ADD447